jgi:hypothetical protein
VTVHLLAAGREEPQLLVWAKAPVIVMLVIVSAVVLLFASVEVSGALVVPIVVVGNVNFVGVTETPVTPLPLKVMVWGLFVALSVIVTAPVTIPVFVGVKVTEMVQFLPALRVVPQVFVCAKGAAVAMLVIFRVAVPVLASVAFFMAVVLPTAWLPKLMLVVESVTCCAIAATVSSKNATATERGVTLHLP